LAREKSGHEMEIDPPYCDVIVQHCEQFMGKKAEREAAA
jgi:hypothetical protein